MSNIYILCVTLKNSFIFIVRGVVREVCEGRCEETLRMAVSPECIDFYML